MFGISDTLGVRGLSTLCALMITAYCHDCLATCEEAAKAQLETYSDGVVEAAQLDGVPLQIGEAKCEAERPCHLILLSSKNKPDVPPAPSGSTYQARNAKWTPLGTRNNCDLQQFVFEKKPSASPTGQPTPPATDEEPPAEEKLGAGMRKATTAQAALEAFRREPTLLSKSVVLGVSESGTGIANEALQIAGQLVVDRASAKGFHLVQSRLKDSLQCDVEETKFKETCAVIHALRIQEIAMAPKLITTALGEDLLAVAQPTANEPSEALVAAVYELVKTLVTAPEPERIVAARTALNALVHYVKALDISQSSNAEKALLYGTLVAAKCVADTDKASKGPACDVRQQLAGWNVPDPVVPAAAELAEKLLVLAKNGISNNQDLALSLGTMTDAACMLTTPVDPKTPEERHVPRLECPSLQSLKDLTSTVAKITIWRGFALAVVSGDAASFALTASRAAQLHWDASTDEDKRKQILRGIRVFAALTSYAATYASTHDGEGDSATQHEQRTKILESLTNDLSNRLEREGDWVASLGGAFRLAGGARFATTSSDVAFLSPISLPLGLAVTRLTDGGPGFHAQVDVVELGNYVSLTKGPEVKEPDLRDALALGASLGLAWGASDPLVLTASASYAPFIGVDEGSDDKGVLSVSLAFGVHVPLLDLN